MTDYGLEQLLSYNNTSYEFTSGHSLRFVIYQINPNEERPHGLYYSFTMHDPEGARILGFDNAHPVPHVGSRFISGPMEADHWHRDETDKGRPYKYVDATTLLVDFFAAVEKKAAELGIPNDYTGEDDDKHT
ncbi:toxin-antitoxin system TumE family protein [Noviherbaspirillum sp. Root189]|uniref:toxin-antitoxin system TumE family protein n=1 Tax=Noviherbaspirillum sp. Root189 TaxID=1736487 RepID=UPI00070F7984|nr:DUF6516 family protein [Noviherbaspirillum sp. Root189]KRB81046.1 hypothetical protein ASE07_24885 [Noviherbaspirillum sp. Root189]